MTKEPYTASNKTSTDVEVENSWRQMRHLTDARIGLGRVGCSIPTKRLLAFQMDHANARDAVHTPLDVPNLQAELPDQYGQLVLDSQASNRAVYLQRPDLGRRLSLSSVEVIDAFLQRTDMGDNALNGARHEVHMTAGIIIVDGLSSTAVQAHAGQMVQRICHAMESERGHTFNHKRYRLAPICIVNQGRVAIGDEIGERLGVDLLILMVGERPGLSSPDSLGIYYTFKPKRGLDDSRRNCISNIRPAGLSFQAATNKLMWLIEQSINIQHSGVMLKDQSDPIDGISDNSQSNFLLE